MKENRIRTKFFVFFSKYIPVPLLIVLLLSLFKGILWISIIPPFQTPDEPAHFTYVHYLAEEGELPVRGSDVSDIGPSIPKELSVFLSNTMYEEIIHYKKIYNLDEVTQHNILNQVSESEDKKANGSNYITSYPPGYYWLASLFYKLVGGEPFYIKYYFIKIFSVILSLITVWSSYMIGSILLPKSKTFPVALATITSLHPMFSMLSTAVTNDMLMICISALILYWSLTIITNDNFPSNSQFILGGCLIGIGLLTKAQVLFVSFFAVLMIIYFMYKNKFSLKNISIGVLKISFPPILIYGWWAIFSIKHYDSIFGVMGFKPLGYNAGGSISDYIHTIAPTFSEFVTRMYQIWIKMYWGIFGSLSVPFTNDNVYKILMYISLLSLIGVIYLVIRRVMGKKVREDINFELIITCLLFVVGNVVFLYVVEFIYFSKNLETMMQGRYLFTALIPINIILLIGCKLLVPKKFGKFVDVTFILGIIILNVYSIFTMLESYYGVAIL